MQALSRYREFAADRGAARDHRAPERAVQRAHEDLRDDAAHPPAGPARPRRAERVLHLPGRRQAARCSTSSPRTRRWRSASRRCSASRPSSRAAASRRRDMGFLDALLGAQAAGRRRPRTACSRMTHGLRRAGGPAGRSARAGAAAIVFQPLATGDFADDRAGDGGGPARHGRGDGLDDRDQRRQLRLPLDDHPRPRHRGPRRRASTRSTTRSRSAATATASCAPSSPSRTRSGKPLYFIYNVKRGLLVPVRARRRRAAAQHRARAADQGRRRPRAALRARARALVPALGHPDLGDDDATSRWRMSPPYGVMIKHRWPARSSTRSPSSPLP